MVRDKVFGLLAGSIFALAPYAAFAQTGSQQYQPKDADQGQQKGPEKGQQKGAEPGFGAGLGEQPKSGEQCECPCGTPGATSRHHDKGRSFGFGARR